MSANLSQVPSLDVIAGLHDGHHVAELFGLNFSSVFQPIFSAVSDEPMGYEALMRVEANGLPISPSHLFDVLGGLDELTLVERLALDLHIKNFLSMESHREKWLFLNIRSQVLSDFEIFSEFFAEILQINQIDPRYLVIEIIEDRIPREDVLLKAVGFLREIGCQVALDDFGAGSSNFERILKVAPNVVKIDRSMTERSAADPTANFLLKQLIPMLHGCNCYVLIEGIETEDELFVALEANADFMQGYYFAKPQRKLEGDNCGPLSVYVQKPEKILKKDHCARIMMDYRDVFIDSANQLIAEQCANSAFFRLVRRFAVEKCYILDEQGNALDVVQLENNRDQMDGPMTNIPEVNHLRRPFFRLAVSIPGQLHISQPYLDLNNSFRCVTLSMACNINNSVRVICCDINIETYCRLEK